MAKQTTGDTLCPARTKVVKASDLFPVSCSYFREQFSCSWVVNLSQYAGKLDSTVSHSSSNKKTTASDTAAENQMHESESNETWEILWKEQKMWTHFFFFKLEHAHKKRMHWDNLNSSRADHLNTTIHFLCAWNENTDKRKYASMHRSLQTSSSITTTGHRQ